MSKTLQFDTAKFLRDQFPQGAAGLIRTLEAYRLPTPERAACKRWWQRGSVPAEWLTILLVAYELENGEPLSMAAYLR